MQTASMSRYAEHQALGKLSKLTEPCVVHRSCSAIDRNKTSSFFCGTSFFLWYLKNGLGLQTADGYGNCVLGEKLVT